MTKYSGVCIGGPRAGHHAETQGPTYVVLLPSITPFNPQTLGWDAEVTSKVEYRHLVMWSGDDTGQHRHGFWVPAEHFDRAHWYVLTELTQSYEINREQR